MIDIQTRVNETKYNHYPLDRMLPSYSVFNIFFENYKREEIKSDFLDNHRYLKMREGYYGLVAVTAFDELENREHFLLFPSNDNYGDLGFLAEKAKDTGEMELIFFDVKEYQEIDKKDFFKYVEHITSKSKILNNQYGLIIGLNRDVTLSEKTLELIKEKSKTLSRGIFICAADPADQWNPNKSICTYFLDGKIFYHKGLEISNRGNDEIIIFQDQINYEI